TILRYAHVYEKRGGLEEHLECVGQVLSERSAVTTVLIHLTRDPLGVLESVEPLGRGRLVRVPILVSDDDTAQESDGKAFSLGRVGRLKRLVKSALISNSLFFHAMARRGLYSGGPPRHPGEPEKI